MDPPLYGTCFTSPVWCPIILRWFLDFGDNLWTHCCGHLAKKAGWIFVQYRKQAGGLTSVQKSAALHWLVSPASKGPPVRSEKLTLSPKHSAVGDCCAGQGIREDIIEYRQQNAVKSVRFYQTTRCHIPEDGKFRSYSGEKVTLKTASQLILIYLTWKTTPQQCYSISLGLTTHASDLRTGIRAS